MSIDDDSHSSILKLLLGLGATVLILAGMRAAAGTINLILLAGLLTLLFVPVRHWLRRHGLADWLSLLVIFVGILAVAAALLVLVGVSFAQVVSGIPQNEQQFSEQTAQLEQQLEALGVDAATLTAAIAAVGKWLFGTLAGLAGGMLSLVVNGAFVLLIFGFMLAGEDGFVARLRRGVSAESRAYINAQDSVSSVVTYLSILATISFSIATADVLLLWFLGIPYVLLWGILAFIFGFIPYIGYWIAIIPPLILAFAQYGIGGAIAVLVGYSLINGVMSNVVAPHFFGKGLNISPVLSLVAVIFWGWLLGPVGAIVGVPLTALLKTIVLESYPETEWLALVMSTGDGKEDEAEAPAEEIVVEK